jgi:hypothetical protein
MAVHYQHVEGAGPSTSLTFVVDSSPSKQSRGSFEFRVSIVRRDGSTQRLDKSESWRMVSGPTMKLRYSLSLTGDEKITSVDTPAHVKAYCGA